MHQCGAGSEPHGRMRGAGRAMLRHPATLRTLCTELPEAALVTRPDESGSADSHADALDYGVRDNAPRLAAIGRDSRRSRARSRSGRGLTDQPEPIGLTGQAEQSAAASALE